MSFSALRQTVKFATVAALTLLAGATMHTPEAFAGSYSNANRINQIINKLSPGGWSHKGHHGGSHRKHRSYGHSRSYYDNHNYGYGYKLHQPYYSGYSTHEYASPYAYQNDYYALDDTIYTRSVDLSVYFERGSSRITWRTKKSLNNLGYALTSTGLSKAIYRIAGHTDAQGDRYANRHLSQKRANAVKKYLVRKFHINPRRLVTVGFGEDRLKDHYRPYSSINRRVEVTLIAHSYADLPYGTYGSAH